MEKSWLLGQYQPEADARFVKVPEHLADEPGYFLEVQTLNAFERLFSAAQTAGVNLQIVSAIRTFERQKTIWENKWYGRTLTNGVNLAISHLSDVEKAERILKYSAMPGTSRHHWGSDFDLNAVEPEYFESHEGLAVLHWLETHAREFGFARPYTPKNTSRPNGYEDEPWHWSYLPVSIPLLEKYLKLIRYSDLQGFAGAALAPSLRIFPHFVAGLSPDCLGISLEFGESS